MGGLRGSGCGEEISSLGCRVGDETGGISVGGVRGRSWGRFCQLEMRESIVGGLHLDSDSASDVVV